MTGRKRTILSCILLTGLLGLCSCGSPSSDFSGNAVEESEQELVYESSAELQYAENFNIDYYQGGYTLLTTIDGTKILTVPEEKEVPKNPDENVILLKQPVENLYLVASGTMDMFCELDALDSIRLSGQKTEGWYLEKAKNAMEQGKILYAGKYDKPDYELIVSEDCSLAVENRMITHAPEVVEKLESFGIPVLIDYSTYENHPLGRVEWIRFWGALLGKEERAEALYSEQLEILNRISSDEKTDKTVAFFFINSNGMVQVRRTSDYVPKMIELAGGTYIFKNLGDDDSSRSTMNIQMEDFYAAAKDADYLIYNSSIDGGVKTVEELLDKSSLLADFKAVKEGNIWCTTNDLYQQSMSIGYLIEDMHRMLRDEDKNEDDMKYLFRVK
ncbi:MAG: ABC transporter substrate-binding protein [Brotaphodocola sp.]